MRFSGHAVVLPGVVDINGKRMLVYRSPQTGDYATQQVLVPTAAVSLLARPGTTVPVADLFV